MKYVRIGAYIGVLYSLVGWTVHYLGVLTGNFDARSYEEWAMMANSSPTGDLLARLVAGLIVGAILGAIVSIVTLPFRRRKQAQEGEPTEPIGSARPGPLATITAILTVLALGASFVASSQIAALQPPA